MAIDSRYRSGTQSQMRLLAPDPEPLAPGSQNWYQEVAAAGVPTFFERSSGPLVFTPEGVELIDLYCDSGAVILGHAHPGQVGAVRDALASGATVSLRHPVERELAAHLVELCPGMRYAAFFKTGSDAVHAAITTAIKATGRTGVLTTTYHGWLLPLGELRTLSNWTLTALDWSSQSLVAEVAAAAGAAACLVVSLTPQTPDRETVRAVVAAARAAGTIVIFDEVKAGFRYAYPTTAASLGIEPDLTVLSKAIGNGFPIAAVLGGDLMADGTTFSFFSTYASELVSLTASLACLRALTDGGYDAFARQSASLHAALSVIAGQYGASIQGVPTFFRIELPDHLDPAELSRRLYQRGVLYHPQDQVLVSAAHDDAVIERVCDAFDDSLRDLAS